MQEVKTIELLTFSLGKKFSFDLIFEIITIPTYN